MQLQQCRDSIPRNCAQSTHLCCLLAAAEATFTLQELNVIILVV
jgi:hypothetical protein